MEEVKLESFEFRRERESSWRQLDRLITSAERRGLRSLDPDSLADLPVLYRAALSSLSVARSISLDRNLLEYLESLCRRAYIQVYGTKQGFSRATADFLRFDLPRTFRRYWWYVATSAAFMVLGTLVGFFMTLRSPDRYYDFVPAGLVEGRTPSAPTSQLKSVLFKGGKETVGDLTALASFLFTHNAMIGMMAFALGIAAGLPVFFLMFYNGLMLGAFAALYASRGLSVELWGWLLPHGVTELSAVTICGAAGLMLGAGLLFPGRAGRLRNLAEQGKQAAKLVMGAVLMFAVAGLFEGIFRQEVTSTPVRYVVAAVIASLWIAYFGFCGRGRQGDLGGAPPLPSRSGTP